MSEFNMIYCPSCGKQNTPDSVLCGHCGDAINQEDHLLKDFLISHVKDEFKDQITGKIFSVAKNWLLSHLYASVVTVTVVAAVTTGAIAAANGVNTDDVSGRPDSIAGLSLLSSAEQALFEENNHHEIFGAEDFEEVWRPAVLEHTLLSQKGTCYGWVIVRDVELQADKMFHGYSEIYICPGVTVTVRGTLTMQEGFTDFYVAKGGTLIVNGDIKGGANICNDGISIINGDYDGGAGNLTCNRGSLAVNGSMSGALRLYSFRGATVTGTDNTDEGIHYHDIDASGLYQGVTGYSGMYIAVGSLQ